METNLEREDPLSELLFFERNYCTKFSKYVHPVLNFFLDLTDPENGLWLEKGLRLGLGLGLWLWLGLQLGLW